MPFLLPILLFAAAANPYDIVIRNGRIIDGTGSPWYAGDLGIRAGKIAALGHLEGQPARRTIDARGMVSGVSPNWMWAWSTTSAVSAGRFATSHWRFFFVV